ncbi:uncharacterized protein LOC116251229 [Nymphaea colorata]|uniref:Uncharacterized protein n=1 Tax=Nymphaea colorata TaxID=210225 RepID=A0A5K1BXG4_9MAGN|nr:uncharacterized protein LOC116251229 [Nymphaea colorata]
MMRPEEVEKARVQAPKRPPGQHPGEVLHQRRSFPFSKMGTVQLTLAGLLLIGAVGYFTLYVKSKPEATASDVAKAAAGTPDSDRVLREQKR